MQSKKSTQSKIKRLTNYAQSIKHTVNDNYIDAVINGNPYLCKRESLLSE